MASSFDRREPVILPAWSLGFVLGATLTEGFGFCSAWKDGSGRMAGDWIKMRHDLRDDPAVIAVSSLLQIADRDLIVGKLHRLWSWFDRHSLDGNARGVTQSFVDSLVDVEGFASALASVGWLDVREGAIRMPNFDRHLSKSAKNRALGQERSQRFRNGAGVTNTLPEKRREEKSKQTPVVPLAIPQPLDTPEFRSAWQAWLTHRCEIKHPLKPTQEAQQLKHLESLGPNDARELIEHTIAMGWRGLRNGAGKDLHEIAKAKDPSSRLPTAEDDANWSPHGDGGAA